MRRLLYLALPLVVLAAAGCPSKRPAPSQQTKQDVSFKLYVSLAEHNEIPGEGLVVVLDGQPIGTISPSAKFVTRDLPADTFGVDLAPRLEAKLTTSCGADSYHVRPYYPVKAQEQEYRAKYTTPETKDSITFFVEGISEAYVYVDNVGGKQRKLAIGDYTIDIPDDADLAKRIRVGKCSKAKALTMDGEPAGELSMEQRTPKAPPATLVDAMGGHCYRRVQHVYKQAGTAATGGASPAETYKGKRAYAIEHPHDFLKSSPKEYEKFADPNALNLPVDWRIEINRCQGTPPRGAPLR